MQRNVIQAGILVVEDLEGPALHGLPELIGLDLYWQSNRPLLKRSLYPYITREPEKSQGNPVRCGFDIMARRERGTDLQP